MFACADRWGASQWKNDPGQKLCAVLQPCVHFFDGVNKQRSEERLDYRQKNKGGFLEAWACRWIHNSEADWRKNQQNGLPDAGFRARRLPKDPVAVRQPKKSQRQAHAHSSDRHGRIVVSVKGASWQGIRAEQVQEMAGIQAVFEELKRQDVLGGLGTEPVKLVRRGEVRILKDELKLNFHLL